MDTAQVEVVVPERGGNNKIVEETAVEMVSERSGNNEIREETVNPPPQIEQQVEYEHDIEKGARANIFSGKIIGKLDQVPREFRKNYIFKVDDVIRKDHENHYEPILVAIGPYHRGKTNLQPMEEHKWQCLNRMIERATEDTGISRCDMIKGCYEVLEGLEDGTRGYYAEDTGLDSSEFLEMLLLDGCFLIQYLLIRNRDDPLFNMVQHAWNLKHDVLLLENQLPFFILEKLYAVMVNGEKGSYALLRSAIDTSLYVISGIRPRLVALDFEQTREVDPEKLTDTKHFLQLFYKVLLKEDTQDILVAKNRGTYCNKYPVTELSNAGVKFKGVNKEKFYDIKFKNGTLEIPRISISTDQMEGMLRNLMPYETGSGENEWIINEYVSLMDSLISSGKDVELLRVNGIIEYFVGDDQTVSTMFNKLGAIAFSRTENYYYSDTVKQLKHHCKKRQNVWMAKLRSDYFSSPWSILSVIAAFVLIVLTIIQTVYSPLSYYNRK